MIWKCILMKYKLVKLLIIYAPLMCNMLLMGNGWMLIYTANIFWYYHTLHINNEGNSMYLQKCVSIGRSACQRYWWYRQWLQRQSVYHQGSVGEKIKGTIIFNVQERKTDRIYHRQTERKTRRQAEWKKGKRKKTERKNQNRKNKREKENISKKKKKEKNHRKKV